MNDNQVIQVDEQEMWAVVELMGHAQTAGRISKPGDWGNLLRVDVPTEDGYNTEFYGISAVYRIKFVSEEIARAYAPKERDVVAYDTPIVTREQHEAAMRRIEADNSQLRREIRELQSRLTAVRALPSGDDEEQDGVPF